MTCKKTLWRMVIWGAVVLATLFSQVETSSGQNIYSAAAKLLKTSSGQDIYSATAILRVSPPYTSERSHPPSPDIMNRRVQNYVKTILCEKIVSQVLCPEKDGLIPPDEKKEILKKHPDIVEILLREIRVRQLPGTDFICITLEGRNRFLITEIVNEIAEAAIGDARMDTEASISETLQVIKHEEDFLKDLREDNEKHLSALNERTLDGERISDFPSRDCLIQKQRILSQKKIAIQLELIAARTQQKSLPEGEKKQEQKQQPTKQIQKYEAQLEWIHHEILENTEQIHAYDRRQEEREKIKRDLRMIGKTIRSLEKRVRDLRIRMRSEKPLESYRKAILPYTPIEKIKRQKSKPSL